MARSKGKAQKVATIREKSLQQIHVVLSLLIIYVASIILRFLLALLTTKFPLCNIDEFLYFGIAKSIASEGELLFRGRETNYQSILYPLLLSPVYKVFKEGVNYFRLLQLWNIMLMSLSVFPLYGISERIIKDKKRSLMLTAVLMLAGDFILGQVIFSENIVYPLFFTAVYCTIIAYEKNGWMPNILLGITAALLYETKPGVFVLPIVSLLSLTILFIKNKNMRGVLQSLTGIISCAVVCFLFSLIRKYAFHSDFGTGLSFYSAQFGGKGVDLHLKVFFKVLPQYLYYFILACGIACFLLPIMKYSGFSDDIKRMYVITLISLAAMIVGTAWTINRYEYGTHAVHLRYIGMYVPLFIIFSVAQAEESTRTKGIEGNRIVTVCVILFVIICAAIWGVGGSETSSAMIHELLSFPYAYSSVVSNSIQRLAGIIVIFAAVLLFGFLFLWRDGREKPNRVLYMMLVFLFVGNITAYSVFSDAFSELDTWPRETDSALQAIDGKGYIFVLTDDRYIAYSCLDVRTSDVSFYVTLNDLFNNLYAAGGKYVPFVSETAPRGTIAGRKTPDVDLIVVDNSVYSMVQLSDYTQDLDPENSLLHVLKIQKDKRLFDTIIVNVESNKLVAGDTGILVLFNEELVSDSLTVRMRIRSESETTLEFFSNAEWKTTTLSPGTEWYEFIFDSPTQAYNFIAEADISILEYELVAS